MKTKGPVLILLLTTIPAFAAVADTRDEVIAGIERCGAIADDRTWLDCLYGADQPMRARLGLPPALPSQQRLVPPAHVGETAAGLRPEATARPVPAKKPGFMAILLGEVPPYAVSKMVAYRFGRDNAFTATLENGQVWQQLDVDSGTVNWRETPSSYEATITQGAFGSYTMHVSGSARAFKVKRVR